MPFDMDMELKRLENKLKAVRQKEFLPDALLEIVTRTAALQVASRADVALPAVKATASPEAHAQGKPLLPREGFPYDPKITATLFGKLLATMGGGGGQLGSAADVVKKALEDNELTMADIFAAFLRDDQIFFADWAARMPDAPSFLRFLAQGSLTPSLEAVADELASQRDAETPWEHGHCPICGSMPLIGSLRDKEGKQHLTCSFCRHDYRAKRLQCAFCGEEDQKKLEYFTAEGEEGYIVNVCRTCQCYIKNADFREMDRVSIPVLDDLESLALDILAREQGFSRPTLSAWGF